MKTNAPVIPTALTMALALGACSGDDGAAFAEASADDASFGDSVAGSVVVTGADGADGESAANGVDGANGADGASGGSAANEEDVADEGLAPPDGLPDGIELSEVELLGPLVVEANPSCLPVGEPFTVSAEVSFLTDDLDSGDVDVSALVTVRADPDDAFEILSQGDGGVSARLVAPDIALLEATLADGRADGIAAVTAFAADVPRPAVFVDRGSGRCAVSGLSSDGSCATAINARGGSVSIGGSTPEPASSGESTQTVGADGATVRFEGCEVVDNPANLPVIELGG